MYRLLTINRVAIEKCRNIVLYNKTHVVGLQNIGYIGKVGRPDTNAFLLQPARYQTVNNDQQRAVYCHLQQGMTTISHLEKPIQQKKVEFNENVIKEDRGEGDLLY